MLGITSSGKSTLVNYLIGCCMKKTKVNSKYVIEIEPTERKQLQQ
jgi:GTPase Era involved in 16S rRNA processing